MKSKVFSDPVEVPISYFDPNNGQVKNLEQRCNELFDSGLFASGVSEIAIPELNKIYTSDPLEITQLIDDVTEYYKGSSPEQSGPKVTVSVVVDGEPSTSTDVPTSELISMERKWNRWANFAYIVGFILGISAILIGVGSEGDDFYSYGLPLITGAIIFIVFCIQYGNFFSSVAKLSAKVRQLEDKIKDVN